MLRIGHAIVDSDTRSDGEAPVVEAPTTVLLDPAVRSKAAPLGNRVANVGWRDFGTETAELNEPHCSSFRFFHTERA
jgi:hypothetical protein